MPAYATPLLSSEDLAKFRVWFLELDHQLWDRQIEADARAGNMPKNNSPLPSKSELRALAAGPLSFDAIEAQYDEETAIQVGILRDPNTHELTAEEAARLQPARRRGKQKASVKVRVSVRVSVRLDADLVSQLRATGAGWQTRLNGLLRQAVFDKKAG